MLISRLSSQDLACCEKPWQQELSKDSVSIFLDGAIGDSQTALAITTTQPYLPVSILLSLLSSIATVEI